MFLSARMHEPCKYLGISPGKAGGDAESRTLLQCAFNDKINGSVEMGVNRYYVQSAD